MALPSRRDQEAGLQTARCRRVLGHHQQAGLGTLRSGAAGDQFKRVPAWALFEPGRAAACTGPVCAGAGETTKINRPRYSRISARILPEAPLGVSIPRIAANVGATS